MIDATRVDYVRSGVRNGAGLDDPAGNRILLHHRYAPYGPR
jgi:hypothetical protein